MKYFRFLILALLIGHTQSSLAIAESVIRIGTILPLSGENASVGEAIQNGITLALERIPKETRDKLKFIYEDDALQSKNTVSAFNKLVTQDNIDIVVNYSSSTGNALAPLAEARELPMIAIASDPQVVRDRKYVVTYWVTPEEEAKMLQMEMLKRKYRKVARISSLNDWSLTMKLAYDKENNGQINMVLDEEYPLNVKDFRSYITKLRNYKDIDGIFLILNIGHLGLFAKQAREQGITAPFFGFEMFENATEVSIAQGALDAQWYVNGDDPQGDFLHTYTERFPSASLYAAPNGHDIALLIAAAVEQSTERKEINDFFHTVNGLSGALGEIRARGDNRFILNAVVKVVQKSN